VQSVVSAKWQKKFISAFITTLQKMEETEPMAASPSPADDSPTTYLSTTEGVEEVMGDTLPPEKGFVQSGRRIELKRRRASAKEGLSTVGGLELKGRHVPSDKHTLCFDDWDIIRKISGSDVYSPVETWPPRTQRQRAVAAVEREVSCQVYGHLGLESGMSCFPALEGNVARVLQLTC
jgi:hypothetical protein